jgi:protein-S-isoprenylcysteine O-methyltransferase Ste14
VIRRLEDPTLALFKTVLFTLIAPATVTVYIPYLLLTRAEGSPIRIDAFLYVGIVPILLGGSIYLRCAWDFAMKGRGTPAPIDPPKELVALGFYRYVRNPMYVGILLILLGESLLFGSGTLLVYAASLFLAFHLFVVLYEEPALRRSFGASYERYRGEVPRWVPRIPTSSRL